MIRIWTAALAALCLASTDTASADDSAPPPERAAVTAATYGALIEKAESGEGEADYTALRLAYAQVPTYDPYSMHTRKLFDDAWKAFENKDCDTVIAKTDDLQKINYTMVPIHFMRGDCFEKAGDTKRSAREFAIGKGLAESELKSGDGKSIETAFHVVTLSEERFILTALEVNAPQQALLGANGHSYDQMTGTYTKTGKPATVYFLVDDLLAGSLRSLQMPSAN